MQRWEGHWFGFGLVGGALGLCLLTMLLLRPMFSQARSKRSLQTAMPRPLPPGATPSRRALWEAQGWRLQAFLAADSEREAQEATDPDPVTSVDREPGRRRRLIAQDRYGYLAQARNAAGRAAALARTPGDAARAAALLARLDCYAGHHEAELQRAQRLVALAPQQPASWIALRRAGRCLGREALVRQAEVKIALLGKPVRMHYPISRFRRDGPDAETPGLVDDE